MAIPQLVLGSFNLMDWAGVAYSTSVIAEGTSKGAPVPIEVAVKSWLQDGSVVATQGFDNRTVTLRVKMRGPNLTAVSQAEAALHAELGKPNTLTWTPASGPASVFVVVTSSMEHAPSTDEDLAEALAIPWRTFNMRLVCEAHVRSTGEVTVPALAATGSTTTLVDNGSATTNWTGTHNGVSATVAVVSGAVGVTTASVIGESTISLTRTASITTSLTKYLQIDWKPTSGAYVLNTRTIQVYGDGVLLPQITPNVSVTGGLIRTTVYVAAASVAALRMDYFTRSLTGGGTNSNQPQARTFHVDNINRTDVTPIIGTSRQQARAFALTGSARAQGSLQISHASNALGDVLAYVWDDPDEDATLYSPAMKQYYSVAGTADAATVFGTRITLAAGSTMPVDVPAAAMPDGQYVIFARAAATAGSFTGALSASTKTMINATNLDTEVESAQATAAFTTAFAVYPVCKMILPSVAVRDRSTATVRLALWNRSASSIYLDEVWAFNLSLGQLIWVQCGTGAAASGGPSRNLFIDPPTVDNPRPSILRGHATDGSDAFHAGVKAWGRQEFVPDTANIFMVTTNTPDASASFRYFPRWHTNAAS